MTKIKLVISLLLAILAISQGCRHSEPVRISYYLTNSSPELIYIRFNDVTAEGKLVYGVGWHVALPNETIEKKYVYPGEKYIILIYKPETPKKYSREELIENDIADYRYEFTYEELEARDFTITFTGD